MPVLTDMPVRLFTELSAIGFFFIGKAGNPLPVGNIYLIAIHTLIITGNLHAANPRQLGEIAWFEAKMGPINAKLPI